MCDPVTAGIILSAVGGGSKAINQQISLRRQDRAAARGIREQGELQGLSNRQVNEQIADIAGSTGEAERGQALEGFLDTLRGSAAETGGAPDPLALGGQRFAERVEGGVAKTRRAGTERAGRLSTVDAARRQRVREGERVALTATELQELQNQSRAQDFITRLRVASKRPNPLVDALGTIAQGAGSVISLGAGGGAGSVKDLISGAPSGVPPVSPFGTPPIVPLRLPGV